MKKPIAKSDLQPKDFKFTKENLLKAEETIKKYPQKKSAVLPLLHLVAKQNDNWIPHAAMDYVASMIDVPFIKVYEVASFYSMFNTDTVGKYFIQVCRTTPCWLKGSDKICKKFKEKLGIELGRTTKDKKFTLIEVECLGACIDAPVVQINNDYYENLNEEGVCKLISDLQKKL